MVKLTEEIEKDLLDTELVINRKVRELNIWSRLYNVSNENLEELFDCFSVRDKKVLTVLASSDQAFFSYYRGAKSVDTFDKNKIAKHYYYLRKWLLSYKGELFPSSWKIALNNEWIIDLLPLVKCSSVDEELSYSYWCSYVERIPEYLGEKLFVLNENSYRTDSIDSKKLINIIKNKELSFEYQDICGEINKNKRYNLVIMSNILEYCAFDRCKLVKCRDNLYDILEDNGEVICSNFLNKWPNYVQNDIFMEKFDYDPFEFRTHDKPTSRLGYCYRKI